MYPSKRPIIAITGSAGKTTTKEMIASILNIRFNIVKSIRNRNLSHTEHYAKSIKPHHQAVVLEYGLLKPGDIKKHCTILQPNISVVTNIGSAHVGNFNSSIEQLAKEKSEIIAGLEPHGTLYINADDTNSELLTIEPFSGSIKTIGIKNKADYKATRIRFHKNGMTFKVRLNNKRRRFTIPVYGIHHIYNALFSIAVTDSLGFTPEEMQKGFNHSSQFLKNNRRLSLYTLTDHVQVLDDTWSANPQATKAAIDVLSEIGEGANIAVLGSMLELGEHSVDQHLDVGKHLARKNVDKLFTFGKDARHIGMGAIDAGFPEEHVFHFDKINDMNLSLLGVIQPDTTVLVKGSHSIRMNRTVKFLLSSFSKAE
ncbi:UDP-N-acetylmuramoyl-tripeptide--D-alanyl-D-alanine ligase [Halobacillus halophilus]|uniref:UDP-N-acetylmuramoyl-tripeptide--D-alanyl-D- alanine ligase n=1 Tax=Halobacillus halophilus TaxID=1570 RepID=UPI001CD61B8A|nr:UDP-N-acetylmuramoyl-tripeptide--D-alanyl-D-alanine ligase [Halobacillus halophilus]MCA1011493.1 UDP-N-acetylmuramoyl-tripeptide--D-alanyl-D-alanine ligase [Halobacillus halophilus]